MRSRIFKNDLSDFHKVTKTVLRETLPKCNPKATVYRDRKSNDKSEFN